MKKIGILYIGTGPYIKFWDNFFNTFEDHFLKNTIKEYIVFTDSDNIYEANNDRVHVVKIKNQPWPLITLLRFHMFLSVKEKLLEYDYLMFSNANIECCIDVAEKEFLPNNKMEKMCFTMHPGYYKKRNFLFPYDRNKKSKAYIPYNKGKYYVIGAMFCGITDNFLNMSEELMNAINIDLQNRCIAQWHDESHLNHYILEHDNCKILDPGYCYPVGVDIPFKKIIKGVPKNTVFDVDKFKGYNLSKRSLNKRLCNLFNRKLNTVSSFFMCFIDFILHKDIKH